MASYLLTTITLRLSDKLQTKLRAEGGIKALLGMVRCRHPDVLAQVARGIANFAKCESRTPSQGRLRKSPSGCHLYLQANFLSVGMCNIILLLSLLKEKKREK